MLVATALRAGCGIMCSEDLHHGVLIHDRLRIVNPFAPCSGATGDQDTPPICSPA